MTGTRSPRLAASLIALFVLWSANAQSVRDKGPDPAQSPALVNTCLITRNVKELVKFYTSILKRDAQMSGEFTC